ncbi:succinyl-CoA--3-ketoacid-CoA transferase [Roseomonas terrae]|uniref:Succinyl-CoA--3-ketoacid-CoA transferase n=1 Tax=Neoroseomonas terrae TaxID=424799 RepID=A0ABS5EEI4_9PROT|nr:CoA-transferase [Neoroseomonas terrae]MBR0649427.1 succinyl-CoA--3-ketoacid-CoA transferase [Neoroseomonas terrae]
MPWSRPQMAERLAREFQDGWIVNLGVGMPTLITDVDMGEKEITFHAENGVIGFGPVAAEGHEDIHLVDASRRFVTLPPGAAIVDHADSFALIRSGRIDVTVLGTYEAAANRDFANWKVKGAKGGVIGGAMDLAACAKNVFLMMEHRTRDGTSRMLAECSLPVTARGRVNRVITELGLFEPTGAAFKVLDVAPGVTIDDIRAATAAPVEA